MYSSVRHHSLFSLAEILWHCHGCLIEEPWRGTGALLPSMSKPSRYLHILACLGKIHMCV